MYKFGSKSKARLATCHADLIAIMELAISRSHVDFGISEGHRSVERQQELFEQGRSKIDGVTRKGKHNYTPSLACDIYIYHKDLSWRRKMAYDIPHLTYVAGVIFSAYEELKSQGKVKSTLRWGADWNRNGIIAMDQSFDDYPHFELIYVK